MTLLILALGFFASSLSFAQQSESFPPTDYKEWHWLASQCHNCPIMIIANRELLHTVEVQEFINTIADKKSELVHLYKIDGQEYNLLAHMAIGILGRESTFFTGRRYKLKETFPGLVRILKTARWLMKGAEGEVPDSSRGPTQIKVVPKKIAETYDITTDELGNPEYAALATMGFLIESLQELKRRAVVNKLDEITPTTYVDYLPYIYMGSARRLINRNPSPVQLNYIREMKSWMDLVVIFELPQEQSLPALHP
ncbi:hypothetical protein D3C72_1184580 [compost metagenome]